MSSPVLRVGTRGSALALAQSRLVVEALEPAGVEARLVVIETDGDRRAPDTAWGEGAFVAALEAALLDGRVDVAVHSAKDVPTDLDRRLEIAAYLPRADPRDALVVRAGAAAQTIDDLPVGARVGTDSPRRTAFLRARRPDLAVHPLHGNVDTRLRRLDGGETDALVLACAGLDRLGLGGRIAERIAPTTVLPAPGQGAIAVEVRVDDEAAAIVRCVDDPDTRFAVEAERSFLHASGGGCRSPYAAVATVAGGRLSILAGHAAPDGSRVDLEQDAGPPADGRALAARLAARLLGAARDDAGPRVLVVRPDGQAAELVAALLGAGLRPVHVPTIEIRPLAADGLRSAAAAIDTFAWVVVTSVNGVDAAVRNGVGATTRPALGWAAVGDGTAAALTRAGVGVGFRPSSASAARLAAELPVRRGDRVLVIRGELAGERLAAELRARGALVDNVAAYATVEAPPASRPRLRGALARAMDAVVITSASAARGLVTLADEAGADVRDLPAVCIGAPSADEARRLGFRNVTVASSPATADIVTATEQVLATSNRNATTATTDAGPGSAAPACAAPQPEVPAHGPA